MQMMHKVYKESITPEVLDAFNNFDKDTLIAILAAQCEQLTAGSPSYWDDLGKLVCTAGLLESLKGGRACALLCDVVNF